MKRTIARTVLFAALAVLAATLVASVVRDRKALESPAETPGAPPESEGTSEAVFGKASQSVVTVKVYPDGSRGTVTQGSGVVVAPGLVATNRHVVESGGEIVVFHRGESHPATVEQADPEYDLCTLRVPSLPAPPSETAPVGTLRTGQRVYAIGAPQGLDLTISSGLVSALRPYGEFPLIQTDASVSQGSSGGGLFDTEGRLVGITTASAMDGQNLNFALAADLVFRLPERGTDIRALGPIQPISEAAQIEDRGILDDLRKGRDEIAAVEAELKEMEEEIDRLTREMEELGREMERFSAARDKDSFDERASRFHQREEERRDQVSRYRERRREYVETVRRRNALVEEYNRRGR